jgi:hypothetical protein
VQVKATDRRRARRLRTDEGEEDCTKAVSRLMRVCAETLLDSATGSGKTPKSKSKDKESKADSFASDLRLLVTSMALQALPSSSSRGHASASSSADSFLAQDLSVRAAAVMGICDAFLARPTGTGSFAALYPAIIGIIKIHGKAPRPRHLASFFFFFCARVLPLSATAHQALASPTLVFYYWIWQQENSGLRCNTLNHYTIAENGSGSA